MNRRHALLGLGAGLFALPLQLGQNTAQAQTPLSPSARIGATHPLAVAWEAWKATYLAQDGRVIDALQEGASHSESQSYGLCLANEFADQDAFTRIYEWTEANLAIRPDSLLAWRWLPSSVVGVPDRNNASDGDLFYAWALVQAARRDDVPAYLNRARAIAADLAANCVVPHPDNSGRLVLLPAIEGFQRDGNVVLNLSYYMSRAMREVAAATGTPQLAQCADDGEAIMAELSGFGQIPDWIMLGPTGSSVAENLSDRNGYEAMRVALFLTWSQAATHPAVARQVQAYRDAAAVLSGTPTIFERDTGTVIERSADPGYAAVAAFIDCAQGDSTGAVIPPFSVDQPYYPATLHLMVLVAQINVYPRCVPI